MDIDKGEVLTWNKLCVRKGGERIMKYKFFMFFNAQNVCPAFWPLNLLDIA